MLNLLTLALLLIPSHTIAYEAPHIEIPPTIEQKIIGKAKAYGYSPQRAVAIAKAESGLDPNAHNPSSTASGLFEFVNGTFKTYCIDQYHLTDTMENKNDPDVQIECATILLSTGGEKHWDASKSMWHNS